MSNPSGSISPASSVASLRKSGGSRVQNAWTVATGVLVVVGVIFRWAKLGELSLWFDEGYTAWITSHPSWTAILHFIRADTAPPLYYIMLQSWTHIVGQSEWGLRSLSAAVSTATILVVWAIAERTLRSRFAQFFAVTLVALSSMQIQYAQEARAYAMLGMIEAITIYCIIRRVEGGGFGFVVAASLSQAAGLYTQNIMLFYVFALFVAWCIWPVAPAATARLRPAARRRLWRMRHLETRIHLSDVIIAGTITLLLYLPWLPTFHEQAHAIGKNFWVPKPTFDYVANVAAAMFGAQPYWELTTMIDKVRVGSRPLILYGGLIAGTVLVLQGLISRSRAALALLICGWLPILIGLMYSIAATSIFLDKAFIASIPPMALLIAIPADGFFAGENLAGKRKSTTENPSRHIGRAVSLAAMIALLLLLVPTLIGLGMDRKKEDWRSAGKYVAELPWQRRLIEFAANDAQPAFDFYYDRYRNMSTPRPIESGVPIGFLESDPPRALQRVLSDADLAPLKNWLAKGDFLEVDLVSSHTTWADPDHRAFNYLQSRAAKTIHWQSEDKLIDVWRFLLPPPVPATTRATTRALATRPGGPPPVVR